MADTLPSMHGKKVPEWAIDRALERFPRTTFFNGDSWKPRVMEAGNRSVDFKNAVLFLAREIAENEKPPADPLTAKARKICAEICVEENMPNRAEDFLAGKNDGDTMMGAVLRALGSKK